MTSKVIRGHKSLLKITKSSYSAIFFCLSPNLFKTFKNVNIMKTQIFDKAYDLKGHPRS